MEEIMKPSALILDEHSFEELLKWHKIHFLGNGSEKFQPICTHINAEFKKLRLKPATMANLSYKSFIGNNFAGLAYYRTFILKRVLFKAIVESRL
jgi:tRNA threonylcarbamoyladenosine biosynthesis protein TsaB